jgi:hypothetical protein
VTFRERMAYVGTCPCGGEHIEGALYYVAAGVKFIREEADRGKAASFLLGPYKSHAAALSDVPLGRDLAHEANNDQALRLVYGTCAWKDPNTAPDGILNARAEEAERGPSATKPKRRRAPQTT